MDFSIVRTILDKEFSTYRKKKGIFYGLIALPLLLGIGFPGFIWFLITSTNLQRLGLISFMNSFSFLFALIATFFPMSIASYSLVGEKVEKSLEPLLTTPITDGELLLAKIIAAFLPSVIITWLGAGLFMVLIEIVAGNLIGPFFFPNWPMTISLLLLVPLACLLSVEFSVIASSRVTDVRGGQQVGFLGIIPLVVIYLLAEFNFITLNDVGYLTIAGILGIIDASLFFLTRIVFRREEMLTKWK